MTRHASAETLARFRDGSLRRGPARRVRAHLDRCTRCRDTSAALAQIPALLAGAEVPPIPAHLAARIETALATESAHRAAGSPSVRAARPGRSGRATHAAHRRSHGRSRLSLPAPALRIAAAAAAVVVVGGGAYALVQGASPSSTGSSSSSAGRPATPPANGSAAGGLVRPGVKSPAAFGPEVRYQAGGQSASIRPVSTSTNYQPAQLNRQVTASLAQTHHVPVAGPQVGLPQTDRRFGSVQLGQLSGCLSRVADGQSVRLVDLAQFRGAPATIIVTAASGSVPAQVWVVGAGCSRSSSDVLDHQRLAGS